MHAHGAHFALINSYFIVWLGGTRIFNSPPNKPIHIHKVLTQSSTSLIERARQVDLGEQQALV